MSEAFPIFHIGILFFSSERERTRSYSHPEISQVDREQRGGTGRTCIQEPGEQVPTSVLMGG